MFAKRYAEYNSLQTTTCEDFSPKKENRNTQNTPDHLFCTLIWHCPIWMKNGLIWLKLVDIAYLAFDEKVQMIYTFHIYIKDLRKSKYLMQIFRTWMFHVFCKPWSLFKKIWWLHEKIILTITFFCRQSGVVPGFGKLWCMDELGWTMFINLNQRTLDVIANIIFNYHLFFCFISTNQNIIAFNVES